jgi:hypothetical protein
MIRFASRHAIESAVLLEAWQLEDGAITSVQVTQRKSMQRGAEAEQAAITPASPCAAINKGGVA